MYSGRATRALPHVGFPIRTSRHHRLVSISTGLIAAAHVLHRLSAPRHPPCALVLLIEKNTCLPLWSFQGAHAPRRVWLQAGIAFSRHRASPSKLNSVDVEVDVVLGETPIGRLATSPRSHSRRSLRGDGTIEPA